MIKILTTKNIISTYLIFLLLLFFVSFFTFGLYYHDTFNIIMSAAGAITTGAWGLCLREDLPTVRVKTKIKSDRQQTKSLRRKILNSYKQILKATMQDARNEYIREATIFIFDRAYNSYYLNQIYYDFDLKTNIDLKQRIIDKTCAYLKRRGVIFEMGLYKNFNYKKIPCLIFGELKGRSDVEVINEKNN